MVLLCFWLQVLYEGSLFGDYCDMIFGGGKLEKLPDLSPETEKNNRHLTIYRQKKKGLMSPSVELSYAK